MTLNRAYQQIDIWLLSSTVVVLSHQPCATSTHSLQALATFGDTIGIAWSGAEDVALVEYAHLTGRPYRVFRCGAPGQWRCRERCMNSLS